MVPFIGKEKTLPLVILINVPEKRQGVYLSERFYTWPLPEKNIPPSYSSNRLLFLL